jgi:hypothetical protein
VHTGGGDIFIRHVMTALKYAFTNTPDIAFRTVDANVNNADHPSFL